MYLAQLDKEKQELFLDLSIHAALSNDEFAKEQKDTIDTYCLEMGLEQSDYKAKQELTIVLDELKEKCNPIEINIVLIEIVALIKSDNVYDTMEQAFMKRIQEKLDISDEKIEKILLAIDHLLESYSMLNDILQQ